MTDEVPAVTFPSGIPRPALRHARTSRARSSSSRGCLVPGARVPPPPSRITAGTSSTTSRRRCSAASSRWSARPSGSARRRRRRARQRTLPGHRSRHRRSRGARRSRAPDVPRRIGRHPRAAASKRRAARTRCSKTARSSRELHASVSCWPRCASEQTSTIDTSNLNVHELRDADDGAS